MLQIGEVAGQGILRQWLADGQDLGNHTSSHRDPAAEIDYYTALHKKVIGREIPHVMLLHANPLNADTMDETLRLFEERGYRFVTLAEAQSDAAYQVPDTFVTKSGPMWGYRWTGQLGIKVDGRLEQEPSGWVLQYVKK